MSKQNNKHEKLHRLVFLKAITIGFFGGIIWSTLFLFMHMFKMTEVEPLFLFQFVAGERAWFSTWYAYLLLIISYGILSVFVAIIYYFLFRRRQSWVGGGIFGLMLFIIIYYILPIIINSFNPFLHFEVHSHIAILCLFILYGVFTGYSISYDYESLRMELENP